MLIDHQSAIRNPNSELRTPNSRAALRHLAHCCKSYSPHVGLEDAEAPESLLLDITGCAHLFGGERGLAERVQHDFQSRNLFIHLAIADTIGAAWAVAHFGSRKSEVGTRNAERGLRTDDRSTSSLRTPRSALRTPNSDFRVPTSALVVPPGQQAAVLGSLPIEALRLPKTVVETLHELDLRRIEQLQALPRASLPSRFGTVITERLDQALGHLPELLTPERPPEPIEALWSFEHPTADGRTIKFVLRRLIDRVVEQLELRCEGALQLLCCLNVPQHQPVRFTVGLVCPTASPQHLDELIRMHLERLTLPGDVSDIRLRAAVTARLESHQQQIFPTGVHRDSQQQLAPFINRLSSRLGRHAVLRSGLAPDAQPEYAVWYEPVVAGRSLECGVRNAECGVKMLIKPQSAIQTPSSALRVPRSSRPLSLLPQPQTVPVTSIVPDGPPIRFRWQNREQTVHRCWGPERIETGWWRQHFIRRDYYRIETTTGERFWLFRQRASGQWFLQGEFG